MVDQEKVDLLLKYIMLVAQENEYGERELGPIHLVKYVYLADLLHAKKTGRTLTGTRWTFHHYGPWSAEVYHRIQPVMQELQAKEKILSNPKFPDDIVRYSLEGQGIDRDLEARLPAYVAVQLKELIQTFGNDTSSLLHYVYRTHPMVKAAPEEELDFREEQEREEVDDNELDEEIIPKRRLQELRAEVRRRLNAKRKEREERYVIPDPPPAYDEIFYRGLQEIEDADREKILPTGNLKAEFSERIWKSKARSDPELS